MRTLWSVVSFLAVVHLLALMMFVGWLWQSQRLTGARLGEIRALLSITAPEAEAARQKLEAEARAQAERAAAEERKAHPPADSASQIQSIALLHRQEQLTLQRLADEKSMLMQQLDSAAANVQQQATAVDAQKADWDLEIDADRKRKTDEQFLQTVRQYEQAAPKLAKRMLIELINDNRMQQAVEYLDAMNSRAAGRILREFKTEDEIPLATELLERLRTFGLPADQAAPAPGVSKEASRANDLASAAP